MRDRQEPSSPSADPSQEAQAAGWLPPDLAANWRVIESLPARGGEADLYVVGARESEVETRYVAKVYRQGIAPKEDVLSRVREADPAHVVQIEAYGQDAGRWWELMEYVEQGSLRQLLEREGPQLPDDLIRAILRQLNDALAGLHRLPLEHRDLKPGNILVRSRNPLELVLTDFGIASVMEASMHFTATARTIRYAPPEGIGSIVSDQESRRNMVVIERTTWDYWSLGMMLVEMLRGAHPYDGLAEAVISHQLLTQNVEDLTADIADPAWRTLCRGLLRRTPSARWDAEAVSKWLVDPNDASLAVAEEAAVAQPSAATIDFDGARYAKPEELGMALTRDWAKAESFWMRRYQDVRTWVTDGLGLQPLGDALAALDDDDVPLATQVFSFVYLLVPNAPTVHFYDVELSTERLFALGERAAANQDDAHARNTLLTLYRQRILTMAGSLPGKEALTEVARRWDDAVSDYERRRAEINAQDVAVPELDDHTLVLLLAGSLPIPAVLSALRADAHRISTKNALACPWFSALGTPEDMSVAALALLPHLQAPAERRGKEYRRRPLRGSVGGLIVGSLFGLLVWWAHEQGGDFATGFFAMLTGALLLTAVSCAFYVAVAWYLDGTAGAQRAWLRRYSGAAWVLNKVRDARE